MDRPQVNEHPHWHFLALKKVSLSCIVLEKRRIKRK